MLKSLSKHLSLKLCDKEFVNEVVLKNVMKNVMKSLSLIYCDEEMWWSLFHSLLRNILWWDVAKYFVKRCEEMLRKIVTKMWWNILWRRCDEMFVAKYFVKRCCEIFCDKMFVRRCVETLMMKLFCWTTVVIKYDFYYVTYLSFHN